MAPSTIPNIGDEEQSEEPLLGIAKHSDAASAATSMPKKWVPRLVPYFMAIHFLLAFCEIILVAPLIRLFENSLCLQYFGFLKVGCRRRCVRSPRFSVLLLR